MSITQNRIAIAPKKDFLERLTSTSSLNALAELIWNGLDAGSDEIHVVLTVNDLGGLEEIRVEDSGTGIAHGELQVLFGNLGDSWKKKAGRLRDRSLHGKNGQGRFKAFALGDRVVWNTSYEENGTSLSYQISGRAGELDSLIYTDPKATKGGAGTKVVISEIQKSHGTLLSEEAPYELAKLFAPYLSQYPRVRIFFDGEQIDPSSLQQHKREIQLAPITLPNGETTEASVSIIEWALPTKRAIHLCDADGVSLHEIEPGIQAPGFHFTVYVKCDHFRELDKKGDLILDELHPDVKAIVSQGKEAVRSHFRRRAAERQRAIVEGWKDEKIYPFVEKGELTSVEEAERQVFEIMGVSLEAYLPKFGEADHESRKFTFQLLAQAVRDNPRSVQKIITEVLHLKKDEQEELAALLERTSLSNIISSAATVANRLDFLIGLENLVFDKETKKKLLERDQLHKILENEAWIFDEEFALSGSEERMEEVLKKHIGLLGERKDGETRVDLGDGKQGRIDLMLGRANTPHSGERDYLVVELKRPSKKIDEEVITQVKKYAMAVASDERFRGVPATWKFVAVSNEMNDFAKQDATQKDKPQGQVWSSNDGKISVWVREWAEVINTARARLDFINESLAYEASRESARQYLMKAHAKFIPEVEKTDAEAPDRSESTR
jgi:hypothetical protein